ncbi:MAG TPA: hypothetical protein VLV17_01920 [Anaeromyxobacteraceae bacterium]|nr:hypothetical protein [Anaeromyxobacteraceae bacterium]
MKNVQLSDKAARALSVVRCRGRRLRYVVDEICHSSRYRLSVRYEAPDGEEVRLGLVYSADREGLEALGARLQGDDLAAAR